MVCPACSVASSHAGAIMRVARLDLMSAACNYCDVELAEPDPVPAGRSLNKKCNVSIETADARY